eukprot:Gb_21544 [translate_table: standard]
MPQGELYASSCGLPNIESPQVHEISNPKSASEHEMCAEIMHIPAQKLKQVSNTVSGSNEDAASARQVDWVELILLFLVLCVHMWQTLRDIHRYSWPPFEMTMK